MFSTVNEVIYKLDVQGVENSGLQVLSFDGIEALNAEYAFEITLINKHLRFDITQLLSRPAYLSFTSDGKNGVHGVMHAVKRGAIGTHYAIYKVLLMPSFSHLHKRVNQRAFVGKTVPQIITTILKEHGILATSHFEFKFKDTTRYQPREFCCQYNESDAHFILRLCEECGIAIHFEHSKDNHKMILSDAQPFFTDLPHPLTYRADTGFVADHPALKRFDVNLASTPTYASERHYNFKNTRKPEESYQGNQHSKANQATEPTLEHYHFPGRLTDQATASYQAQLSIERLKADHILAEMYSDIPNLHTGYCFTVEDFPVLDNMSADEPWLIKQIKHQGRQPQVYEAFAGGASATDSFELTLLPKYFKHPVAEELQFPSEDIEQGYRNCSIAVPKNVPYRPKRLHFKHKVLGAQTAVVTGPAEEEIYCDEYGRVKVQFMWDRLGHNDEHSSHWIRVANLWAHNRYGGIEIPRIGMEVVVDFIEGDIDAPLIRGAIHNGVNKVPYDLPAIKTQSTLKSKEYKGDGYNEVLLDDTTGQVKTQIHSTPGTSQLSLGYLTHPRQSDGGGEHRGDGFELRTDEWGAIRAAKGIYLTANERGGAGSTQLDLKEAIEQLEYALNLAKDLAETAQMAEVRKVDTVDQQNQLDTVYKELTKPGILASAPEGIALVTPKSVQVSAQSNLTFTAGQHADVTTQKDFRVAAGKAINLFAIEEEIKLAANKGKVQIQAQNNAMEIYADKNLKILSSTDRIEIAAQKEILLTSGKAYIKIADGNILIHAPGMVETKAATQPHAGPASMNYNFLSYDPGNDEMFVVRDDNNNPIPNFSYKILREDGQEFYGVTNAKGETLRVQTGENQLKLALYKDNRNSANNSLTASLAGNGLVYEAISQEYHIKQIAFLPAEGVGVGGTFFIRSHITLGENGALFISARGDTAAKAAGTIRYDMYAEIRVDGQVTQKGVFSNSEPGFWPDDGYSPIGTVKMALPAPQSNSKITLFLSASYTFSTGHGSAVPMTSMNVFSKDACRATKEIPLTVKNGSSNTYSV